MKSCVGCLRVQIEKWFGREGAPAVGVLEFRRMAHDGGRFVRMGAQWPGNQVAIVFFRHHDGTWNVFSPPPRTATMLARTDGLAASLFLRQGNQMKRMALKRDVPGGARLACGPDADGSEWHAPGLDRACRLVLSWLTTVALALAAST